MRVIHGRVAVRMVPAEHVADAGGGLFEGLVRGQVVLVHGVEDAPVHGLETVAHIRQRTSDDDGHGILDVRGLHLMDELALNDLLVGIEDVLRFIVLGHGCTTSLNVNVDRVLGVLLDERLARLDLFAHEHGEHLVGVHGVLERDAA